MKQYFSAIFVVLVILVSSCGESSSTKEESNQQEQTSKDSYKIILSLDYKQYLKKLAGNQSNREVFKLAMKEAAKAENIDDFIDMFTDAVINESPELSLATLFSNERFEGDFDINSTNEEVKSFIKSELIMALERSYNIIRKRVELLNPKHHEIQWLGSYEAFEVIIYGVEDKERVQALVQSAGDFAMVETYDVSELWNQILDINKILSKEEGDSLNEYPLFTVLTPPVSNDSELLGGPIIGYAKETDKERVMEILSRDDFKALFPAELKFLWSVVPVGEEEPLYQLLAIKDPERYDRYIDGSYIYDVFVQVDENYGMPTVYMNMNEDGAELWAKMTEENVGKNIAIILDNKVYSFPQVMEKISGGMCQISGQFTMDEAKDLANLIATGSLVLEVEIVSVEEI